MQIMNLQLISCTNCPNGMTRENCPAWQYVLERPELFQMSINENLITLARPYGMARGKYEGALMNIFDLCERYKEPQR